MAFCPVCGSDEKNPMRTGDICTCCFNEVGFEDDKSKQEILFLFCNNNRELMYEIAPEAEDYDMDDTLPVETVNKFLRLIWIQQGCYHFRKIKFWSKEKGIQQLKNIGINYNTSLEKQAFRLSQITRSKNGDLVYAIQ